VSNDGLRLDWCDYRAAKWAVQHWYHRPEMPVGKLLKIGVWEDGQFSGVVLFGMSASDALGRRWGLGTFEVCELARLCLRPGHACQVSRVVRIALLMLRRRCPGIRAVVTFAEAEHHGGVYQAGGWVYTGTTAPDWRYTDAAGREWHSREVSASGWRTMLGGRVATVRAADCTRERVPGKHRFVMPLDAEMSAMIERDRKVPPAREA
jgi:hypothetical protein